MWKKSKKKKSNGRFFPCGLIISDIKKGGKSKRFCFLRSVERENGK